MAVWFCDLVGAVGCLFGARTARMQVCLRAYAFVCLFVWSLSLSLSLFVCECAFVLLSECGRVRFRARACMSVYCM